MLPEMQGKKDFEMKVITGCLYSFGSTICQDQTILFKDGLAPSSNCPVSKGTEPKLTRRQYRRRFLACTPASPLVALHFTLDPKDLGSNTK